MSSFFTSLVNYTHFRPAFPAYPKVSLQIQEAMELVMNGTSPTDAMSNFADAVKGIAGQVTLRRTRDFWTVRAGGDHTSKKGYGRRQALEGSMYGR